MLELTGKKEPADGLQAKFSVYHGCAAGLTFGHAAEEEFSDDVVNRPDMVALRRKVVATVDDSIDEASADVTAVLADGRRVHVFVEHAIGSLQNPMTDANLGSQVPWPVRRGAGRGKNHRAAQGLLGPGRRPRRARTDGQERGHERGQAPHRRARRQRTRHAPPGRLARASIAWPTSTSTTSRCTARPWSTH